MGNQLLEMQRNFHAESSAPLSVRDFPQGVQRSFSSLELSSFRFYKMGGNNGPGKENVQNLREEKEREGKNEKRGEREKEE